MTDYALGAQHGFLGYPVQYPHNRNYMDGYRHGQQQGEWRAVP